MPHLTLAELQALKTELATDPSGYGYGNSPSTDAADAQKLNLSRPAIRINRADVPTAEIWSAIVVADYDGLTEPQRAWLDSITRLETISFGKADGSDSAIKSNLKVLFPDGSQTRVNLDAIFTRDGSRVEQLLGPGISVTPSDVANARNS